MAVSIKNLYLPDTNILVHYIRDDSIKRYVESQFQLLMTEAVPILNCAIEAETRSISAGRTWGGAKIEQMEFLFSTFRRVSIERSDIIRAYTLIDVYSHRRGIDMGKNDLWIAATASVTGSILLTTDKDFDHLESIFLTRVWIDPHIGKQFPDDSNNSDN
jgi:predicted nucleic acid-binding protein